MKHCDIDNLMIHRILRKQNCILSFQWRDLQKALRVSAKLNLPDLREFVLRRSIENFDEFAESQEFVMMDENELQVILFAMQCMI